MEVSKLVLHDALHSVVELTSALAEDTQEGHYLDEEEPGHVAGVSLLLLDRQVPVESLDDLEHLEVGQDLD